ncbi:MAG TPA: hypothetical protein VGG75_09270 [Trebonia sp.]
MPGNGGLELIEPGLASRLARGSFRQRQGNGPGEAEAEVTEGSGGSVNATSDDALIADATRTARADLRE